jgi:DTW domain-containing protein
MLSDTPDKQPQASCPNCWKPTSLCVCGECHPIQTRTRFLVLQHPQEARNPLNSARLIPLALSRTVHRVGLSWRSLSAALGEQTDPQCWGVLYLGTLKHSQALQREDLPFQVVGRTGKVVPAKSLQGIVLLDGNWKQSKTLWWRNPWLLKLNRILLNPTNPSLYGEVRKEPRKLCLSSVEAAAESLVALGESQAASEGLKTLFGKFLEKVREVPIG